MSKWEPIEEHTLLEGSITVKVFLIDGIRKLVIENAGRLDDVSIIICNEITTLAHRFCLDIATVKQPTITISYQHQTETATVNQTN